MQLPVFSGCMQYVYDSIKFRRSSPTCTLLLQPYVYRVRLSASIVTCQKYCDSSTAHLTIAVMHILLGLGLCRFRVELTLTLCILRYLIGLLWRDVLLSQAVYLNITS